MKALGIDCSTSIAQVCLIDNEKVLTEKVDSPHCEKIMVKIDEMLKSQNLEVMDLDSLCVVLGPGSFTGIRIAVATIKGMSVVNKNAKLIGLNSFDIVAENVREKRFLVVLESGNEDKYVALYENFVCKQIFYLKQSEILAYCEKNKIKAFANLNEKEFLGDGIEFVEISQDTLYNLMIKKTMKNEFCQINELVPIYVKLSQAERARSEKILANLVIEPAKNSRELFEIDQKCFSFDAWSESLFDQEIMQNNKYYYIAKYDGNNIGFVGFETNLDDMNLQKIAVLEDYRNCGVATKLFEYSLQKKQELNKDKYFLEVDVNNQTAVKLYEKLGFKVLQKRENYYKNGDACFVMQYSKSE